MNKPHQLSVINQLIALVVLFFVATFVITLIPIQAIAPTSGLVGYWNFDEGSGTMVTDSSGNGNNGTARLGLPGKWEMARLVLMG